MSGRIQDEVKSTKPLDTLEQEAFLNLMRTAMNLQEPIQELLRPHNLSMAQYNVLRILRGSRDKGLPCKQVGERMVTRVPDVTRLLDRLEARDFVTRCRDTDDRRVVLACITDTGQQLLAELDQPMQQAHLKQLSHLGDRRLKTLIDLLEAARGYPVDAAAETAAVQKA